MGMPVGVKEVVPVGVGVGRAVAAVGDPVIDDTGVNEGALVTASLGATSEYVTFLTT